MSHEQPSFLARMLSRPAARFVPRRVIQAAQDFMHIEAASGLVLMAAAIFALAWANSPWSDQYFDLLHTKLSVDLDIIAINEDLQHWINDGLMTIFFFLMGLEIKREMVHGELSSPRRALLPAAGAMGGMLAPALIYVAFNAGGEGSGGWGIPMATDIAFALGVLSLLGPRIPFTVKVFLLALAIADDIGAILVIAFFYTSDMSFTALGFAAVILAVIFAMNRGGVRSIDVYVPVGIALWIAIQQSGVHATLTGVILGLLTPASYFYNPRDFGDAAQGLIDRFRRSFETNNVGEQQGILAQIESLSQGTESPLERLEHTLHPWSSFLIVPLFALANAGVTISSDVADAALSSAVSQGVVFGLLVGKPLGIFVFTFVAVRTGLCEMPAGATWKHIFGVGLLGGIGFTVSLLITGLAFDDARLADEAKLGVLCASVVTGVLGYMFLRMDSDDSVATPDSPAGH